MDNNGSSHFIELSASARKIARIWINEIRKVTHQNSGNQSRDSISINLTSSGTSSSTKSKASTYSHSSGSSANKLNPRPRVDSLLIPSVSFPKSVKIQPNLITSPYLSPPVMGYKCEMKDINIDNMYKQISPETQNESLYSDSVSPIEHIRDPNARERYSRSSFNSDFMNNMGLSDSEHCDDKFMQKVDGAGTTTDSDNFYDTIVQEPHISSLQIADFKISPTTTKSSSEDEDDHSIVRESLQSCQRISRKEFKSLYNSMQVKVQEYLELKNRIDSIVGNLNKT